MRRHFNWLDGLGSWITLGPCMDLRHKTKNYEHRKHKKKIGGYETIHKLNSCTSIDCSSWTHWLKCYLWLLTKMPKWRKNIEAHKRIIADTAINGRICINGLRPRHSRNEGTSWWVESSWRQIRNNEALRSLVSKLTTPHMQCRGLEICETSQL